MCWQGAKLQLHVGFERHWLARSFCGGFAELSPMHTTSVILSFLHEIVLSSLVVKLYKLVHVYSHLHIFALSTPALAHRLPFP
jgi:hypothetical protein